ncbi:hypothetical protein N7466_009081 [Penicillium verhagenii]|uniref:uncharacterized protein n=1 Tax=Penicillium verhagenii TaxID=1562060 RepID=UPI0025457341|nr:uncharacterized protein N7466_009081 [Penicillium verhagenii]KAJ5920755.1 hypothetical protein N7466_009081 [Penicillium verhagenii]
MSARHSIPSSNRSNLEKLRKRVCKACDRCRSKKTKCDGLNPCSRCRADNTVCCFGHRKKSHEKVYPKGYADMLEQQQIWLVHGLQELYRRATKGEGWSGAPLKLEPNGLPLTHDLLTRIGVLDDSGSGPLGDQADIVARHKSPDTEIFERLSHTTYSGVSPDYLPGHLISPTLSVSNKTPSALIAQKSEPESQNLQYELLEPGAADLLPFEGMPQWPTDGLGIFDDDTDLLIAPGLSSLFSSGQFPYYDDSNIFLGTN